MNSPVLPSTKTSIVRQGWLWLDTSGESSIFRMGALFQASEDRFWVILQRDRISWFARKRVSVSRIGEPHGSARIDRLCDVRSSSSKSKGGDSDVHRIELTLNEKKVLRFRAASLVERDNWTRAFASVISLSRRQQNGYAASPARRLVVDEARDVVREAEKEGRAVTCDALEQRLATKFGRKLYDTVKYDVREEFARWNGMRSDAKDDADTEDDANEARKVAALGSLNAIDREIAESVFWMMVSALEKPSFALRGLFISGMPQLEFCLYAFERLLERRDRLLAETLTSLKDELQIPIFPTCRLYATQWFMTFFARDFPLELCLRVWDLYLLEGWSIVFKVALYVMETARKTVLSADFEGALQYLQHKLPLCVDVESMMSGALAIKIEPSELEALRLKYKNEKTKGGSYGG